MCSCQNKISGMRKRKTTRRRRRVSGVTTGLFTTKTLVPAAATLAVDHFLGDKLPILQTKTGAIGQAIVGGVLALTNVGGRSAMKKGIGLGLLAHGGYKYAMGKTIGGAPVAGIGSGYSYYLGEGQGQYQPNKQNVKKYV